MFAGPHFVPGLPTASSWPTGIPRQNRTASGSSRAGHRQKQLTVVGATVLLQARPAVRQPIPAAITGSPSRRATPHRAALLVHRIRPAQHPVSSSRSVVKRHDEKHLDSYQNVVVTAHGLTHPKRNRWVMPSKVKQRTANSTVSEQLAQLDGGQSRRTQPRALRRAEADRSA